MPAPRSCAIYRGSCETPPSTLSIVRHFPCALFLHSFAHWIWSKQLNPSRETRHVMACGLYAATSARVDIFQARTQRINRLPVSFFGVSRLSFQQSPFSRSYATCSFYFQQTTTLPPPSNLNIIWFELNGVVDHLLHVVAAFFGSSLLFPLSSRLVSPPSLLPPIYYSKEMVYAYVCHSLLAIGENVSPCINPRAIRAIRGRDPRSAVRSTWTANVSK